MGKLIFEGTVKLDLDDRTLAQVQFVIGNKLRRGEPFFFTWREDPSVGDGRTAVWVHPGADIAFRYHGSRVPPLNRAWLEALAYTANSPGGLHVVPEPAPESVSVGLEAMD